MRPEHLALLRCPIDPDRAALLTQNHDQLICERCRVCFPIKQGLPVLIPSEGELPDGTPEMSGLPCQRRFNRAAGKTRFD